MRSLAWCMLLAACGKDVRLGTEPPDALVDAPPIDGHPDNPFANGSYALAFVDPSEVVCDDGDLVGMEASFTSITRTDLNFVDGTVTIEAPTATTLIVSGAPISTAYGIDAVTLTPDSDPPPGEPVLWGVDVAHDLGVGPLSTTNTQRVLVLDSSTGAAAQIGAIGGAMFANGATPPSACTVVFIASLTPQ